MADIASLIKALKDKAVAQYDKGAPYRDALVSALRGDTGGVNQALSKSELTPVDVAMSFAPTLGGTIKIIKPAKESLQQVADSNFTFGIPVGNKTVDINSLNGMMSTSTSDATKVNKIMNQMKTPEGYIERLIIDDKGNVIEGQHRLNALRNLGETKVPVSVIKDMSNAVDSVKNTGMRNEHARQIVQQAHDMLNEAKTPENAFQMFDIPNQYANAYKAAFESIK
jgi:hypothetical protein